MIRILATGSYSGQLVLNDRKGDEAVKLQTPLEEDLHRLLSTGFESEDGEAAVAVEHDPLAEVDDEDDDQIDFGRRVLHVDWHPKEDLIAMACLNNVYLFQKQSPS